MSDSRKEKKEYIVSVVLNHLMDILLIVAGFLAVLLLQRQEIRVPIEVLEHIHQEFSFVGLLHTFRNRTFIDSLYDTRIQRRHKLNEASCASALELLSDQVLNNIQAIKTKTPILILAYFHKLNEFFFEAEIEK